MFIQKKSSYNKLNNCVKVAIAFVCTTCKRQLLFALLQQITFVCPNAIENILSTTPIVNFCMHYCNCQHFMEQQLLYVLLLQPLQLTPHYYSYWLLNGDWQLFCTIAIDHFCMLQTSINNISCIDCNYAHTLITALLLV